MILRHFLLGVLFVFPLLPAFSQAPTAGPLAPTGLTCEYMVDPLGIERPPLGFGLDRDRQGAHRGEMVVGRKRLPAGG